MQFTLVFAAACGWLFFGWPQILNFPPQPRSAEAATLTYVGGAEASGNSAAYNVSLTGLTGGIASAAAEGDLVIVSTGFVSTSNGNPGVGTAGYTELNDLYANDTRDANFSVNWKLMGVSPDTTVSCNGSGSASNGAVCVVHVWRGADQTTPFDVASTSATATNSAVPNSPSITPTTSGAIVISTGLGTGSAVDNSVTAPTGYSNKVDISVDPSSAATVGISSKSWSSGAEDPAAWTTWTTSTSDSWAAMTLAIRPAVAFDQSSYRFFNNSNATDVGSALAAQDTVAALGTAGAAFRLRILMHISDAQLGASGENFKLQFAARSGTCDTGFSGETYADVTGATVIAYNNNATPADGDNLTANANDPTHGGDTIVNQDYEEANNFTNTVAAIPAGQDGKWDFSLIDNGAGANTAYCFRVVKSDGSVLDTYTQIPQISTAATLTFIVSTQNFSTITPGSPVFATSTLSVDTDNTTGWNVTVVRDDADTTMDLDSNAGVNIADQTAWAPGAATTTAGNAVRIGSFSNSGDVLAFRVMSASGTIAFRAPAWWGSADTYTDNANTLWAGFPSTAKKVGESSVSSGGSPALSTVVYYLDVPETQQNGAYSGGITYTAIMNP
ncbi:hypothetical protein HYT05_04020 [Candidatus Kaiserbacteria bacterium]|nr:hypothetical protein [Candidatus Kaiserbacteria bacterium]